MDQPYNPYGAAGPPPQQNPPGYSSYGQPQQAAYGMPQQPQQPHQHQQQYHPQPQQQQQQNRRPQPQQAHVPNPNQGQPESPYRPYGEMYAPGAWHCPACSYQNPDGAVQCTLCFTHRLPMNVQEQVQTRHDVSRWGWNQSRPHTSTPQVAPAAPEAIELQNRNVANPEAPVETDGVPAEDKASFLCFKQETFQYVFSFGMAGYQLFKIVMASLLSVFVPQKCPDDIPYPGYLGEVTHHECTFQENFQELDSFNIAVVTINFVTLFLAIILYFCALKREAWLIKHLDEDPTVTNDFLVRDNNGSKVIDLYPSIRDKSARWNRRLVCLSTTTVIVYFVNVVISAVLIFGYWYLGFQTITVFLTNTALCVSLIFSQWNYSRDGIESGVPYSLFKTDPSVYNNIDRAIKQDPKYFKPPAKAGAVGAGGSSNAASIYVNEK